jgi:hypothetical protein
MTEPRQRRRGALPGLAALSVCILALAVAACGGGSSPGVANLGKSHHSSNANNDGSGGGAPSSVGGSSSPSNGHNESQAVMKPVGASAAQELRYAKCMRANGEPNFPDPNSQGAFSFGSAQGIDANSTQFQAAQSKCGKDLPHPSFSPAQQQQDYAHLLKYSQCMRGHGVPGYPDPTRGSGGGVSLSIRGGPDSGLDPNSPIFQHAQQACSKLPGAPPGLGGGGK